MVMMDIKEKESSSEELGEKKKCCADCKTTKTPLWRGGPAGPKTLCNACGIKYRKKRASPAARLVKGQDRKRERSESCDGGTSSTRLCGGSELKESFRMKLMAVGEEVLLQRSSSVGNGKKKQRRNNLGEEEKQAAICLMALSCGYVFA